MPQPRAVIRHLIRRAGDIETPRLVAVQPLVHCLEAEQVQGKARGGDSLLGCPRLGRRVVSAGGGGQLCEVHQPRQDHVVAHGARQFEVGVSDAALRVVSGHQLRCNLVWEREPPQGRREPGGSSLSPCLGSLPRGVAMSAWRVIRRTRLLLHRGETPASELEEDRCRRAPFPGGTDGRDGREGGAQGCGVEGERARESHVAHAGAGGVARAHVRWGLWHDFGDTGRTAGDVLSEPSEVVDGVLEPPVEVHTISSPLELLLEPRHAAHSPRDGDNHAAELPHELLEVPFRASAAKPGEGRQHLVESHDAVRGQLDRSGNGVNDTAIFFLLNAK